MRERGQEAAFAGKMRWGKSDRQRDRRPGGKKHLPAAQSLACAQTLRWSWVALWRHMRKHLSVSESGWRYKWSRKRGIMKRAGRPLRNCTRCPEPHNTLSLPSNYTDTARAQARHPRLQPSLLFPQGRGRVLSSCSCATRSSRSAASQR